MVRPQDSSQAFGSVVTLIKSVLILQALTVIGHESLVPVAAAEEGVASGVRILRVFIIMTAMLASEPFRLLAPFM